jgi:pimeloyl-ACP methyl ester carboxylesterase
MLAATEFISIASAAGDCWCWLFLGLGLGPARRFQIHPGLRLRHSGIAWSHPGPTDSCSLRVKEIHSALTDARILGPFVLVGHSPGALVGRLYAAKYAGEVASLIRRVCIEFLRIQTRRTDHEVTGP